MVEELEVVGLILGLELNCNDRNFFIVK